MWKCSFCCWLLVSLHCSKIDPLYCFELQNLLRLSLELNTWCALSKVIYIYKRYVFSYFAVKYFVYASYVHLVCRFVQVFYFFVGLLCSCSIHYWECLTEFPKITIQLCIFPLLCSIFAMLQNPIINCFIWFCIF